MPTLFRTVAASRAVARPARAVGGADWPPPQRDMDELNAARKAQSPAGRGSASGNRCWPRSAACAPPRSAQATGVQKDAAHWVELKRAACRSGWPKWTAITRRSTASTWRRSTRRSPKAETDWPEKKPDLDARLAALRGDGAARRHPMAIYGRRAPRRRRPAISPTWTSARWSPPQDACTAPPPTLPQKAAEIQALTGQLYDSWDKMLVDMEVRGIGSARALRPADPHRDARIWPTPRPKPAPALPTKQWVDVSESTYNAMQQRPGHGRSSTSRPASTISKPSAWRSRRASPTWRRPARGPTSTAIGTIATAATSGSSTASTR